MATKKQEKSNTVLEAVLNRVEGTIVERPIVVANKTYLASLGLANQFQQDFGSQFDKLAKDGEKVRDEATASVNKARDQVLGRAKKVRVQIAERIDSVLSKVLEYSPIATTADVEKLNAKLDKALRVAK